MDDIAGPFIALISFGVIALVVISVVSFISSALSDLNCGSYKVDLQKRDVEIAGLREEIASLKNELNQSEEQYNRLISENITKQDFEFVRQDINSTKAQINILGRKFDYVTNSYATYFQTVNNYLMFSFAINLFFVGLFVALWKDIVSIKIFNVDLKEKLVKVWWEGAKRKWKEMTKLGKARK
ncbi:MAG: hypothetical protein JW724_03735 [Candidatus Altiarchaeota archaeon]|nr:hypothetical protein [Candidatus Altiarchaeota archaeon]